MQDFSEAVTKFPLAQGIIKFQKRNKKFFDIIEIAKATNSRSISFMYDAGGNKLRKTVVQSGVTQYTQDYVGGIEYRNGVLEAIYHAEGRITNINSILKYEYALKDHLGNTRIMFCDKNGDGVVAVGSSTESSEVTQENHYYPFGLNMEGVWSNTPSVLDSKYLYNGKELNDDFGLGLSDYGARFYDAAIGQWSTFDPMAEAYQSMSPYHYGMNNPMRFTDPNGMYSNDGTTSRNTSALATDGSLVGGSSHFESDGQKDGLESNTTEKQNRTRVSVGGEVVADHADDEQVEQNQASVIIWATNGDVGHTAIRIGETFYGYYPTDINGDHRYTKEDLENSPGEMHIHNLQEFTDNYKGDIDRWRKVFIKLTHIH